MACYRTNVDRFNISIFPQIQVYALCHSLGRTETHETAHEQKKLRAAPTLRLLPIEVKMNDDVPEAVQWNNQDEGAANRAEHISNLRNRARREFFRAEEKLSDFHREYLLSLVDEHPYTNHIYGE